jgi:SRSO17 transposase
MVGQLSQLERKSMEPMALHVAGGTVRGLQRFMSDVPWDEEQMLWHYHQLVAEMMGAPDGILMFDETGFVKKGTHSVGVARQYCGSLGKVDNCQVGVFAGYASRQGYEQLPENLSRKGFVPIRGSPRRVTSNVHIFVVVYCWRPSYTAPQTALSR